jgi:hypothetical protein
MRTPWWKSLGRIVWWLYSRVWAPLMAIGWPALVVYGLLVPRAPDQMALRLQPTESALLIGVAGGGSDCVNNHPCNITPAQRSYIVIPRVFSNAAVTVVEDTNPQLTATKESWDALLVVGIWVACVILTWHYWVRPAWHLTTRSSGR